MAQKKVFRWIMNLIFGVSAKTGGIKKMNNKEFQSGDLIFWYTNDDLFGNLQRLVNQPVGHVAIVYDVVLDEKGNYKVRVVEAMPKGLERNIYDISHMNLAVKRSKKSINIEKMRNTIDDIYTERVLSGNNAYPFDDLADAGTNAILKTLTFGLWQEHRLAPNNPNLFCSEFVAEVYDKYGDKIAIVCNDVIKPTDEYRSEQFYMVRDFDKSKIA